MTLAELLATPPYNTMTDAEAAAAINAATVNVYQPLDTRALLRWGFGREGLSNLRDAVDRAGAYSGISAANRARAIAAYAILTEGIDGTLDPNDSEIDGMLDLLVSTGIFVAQDKADLLTRATVAVPLASTLDPPMSRVRVGEVERAR